MLLKSSEKFTSAIAALLLASAAAQPLPGLGQPPHMLIPTGTTVYRDISYVANGHIQQKMDIYLPQTTDKTPLPLIVAIHGGAFKFGDKADEVPADYLARGYAVASLNYRLSGDAIFPAQIEDCKAAVRWLRTHANEYGFDPNRFAAFGSSAGGNLVALLGTTGRQKSTFDVGENPTVSSRVQAVVDNFGPTDFLQMDAHRLPSGQVHNDADSPESELIGGAIQQNRAKVEAANPIAYIGDGKNIPPFLIIHGDSDPLVPHHQSELLVAALTKAKVPVTFYTVKGGSHGGFADPQVAELQRAFLDKYLKGNKK